MVMNTSSAEKLPQSEFVDFWNRILVPKFITWKHVMVDGLGRHSDAIFPTLDVKPGEHVMDAGCGFGDTACMLAERVGSQGEVVGIDCCEQFLEFGREEASKRGLNNVKFVQSDLEKYSVDCEFDLVFARFGTMFFTNPVAAFRNLRSALHPGGRLTNIVWRCSADNPWLSAAKAVVLHHLPPPGDNAETCGPGPFSMADQDVVTAQLRAAGFECVRFERVDAAIRMGNDIDDAIGFQLALGPAGEVVREAGHLAAQKEAAIRADLAALLRPHLREDGVWMNSSSWVISARNPG